MKDNAVLPALSIDGWVDQPMNAASYLFSHLFLSDYSQSYVYYTNVSSIAYLLHINQASIEDLAQDLRRTVKKYFSRYYDRVDCDVVDSSGTGTSGSITLSLDLVDAGEVYNLNKVINFTDSKIKSILDFNNFG